MVKEQRTSLLVRCSREEAATIRNEASSQRRSVTHYLLHVLDRSVRMEETFLAGAPRVRTPPVLPMSKDRTSVHFYCTTAEADKIRAAAKRRLLSISGFVVFSLRRHWKASEEWRSGLNKTAI